MDESESKNIQCNLKNGEKVLKNEEIKREKICANSEQKLEESKLTFECNLAASAKAKERNESNNFQKLCFMARVNFYGTKGDTIIYNLMIQ